MNPLLHHSYISYVNLDKRPERRAGMEKELQRVGITSAVRTRGMLPEEYKGDPRRIHGMLVRPQKGAIGCYFSQLSIIRKAQAMNLHAFVMEDDLQFCDDFLLRMDLISEFLDQHPWDILWLGATFHVGPPWWHKDRGRDAEQTDDPRMIRTYGAFCTYAYIINSFSIPQILNALEYVLPTSIGIDYSFIQIQPSFQAFAFVPGSVIQYDHQSDIGHGMTEFSKFSKLGPYWFQRKMEDFDPVKYNWAEAKRRK